MKYTCPISKNTVDENVVRLIGFFSLILVILGFLVSKWFFLFLSFEYLMRIFVKTLKFSILRQLAIFIMHKVLKIKPKEIGAAPKRFAAIIGFLFSIFIFATIQGQIFCTYNCEYNDYFFSTLTNILTLIFVVAISLETFFSYCLGCKFYSWLQFLKNKFKK